MDYSKYTFNPFQFTPSQEVLMDAHERHVPFFKGCKRVLDLGAGRGLFLRPLKEAGILGLGVENHSPSIEEGRAYGLEYFNTDMFEFFSSPEGQKEAALCDGVYCCFVLEHLVPEEVFQLFRLIKTYCAPNVRCRFITHNPADIDALGTLFYGDLTHKRLYVPAVLAEMAKSQGFTKATHRTFLGMRLGKKDSLRRIRDYFLWGKHKWQPNFLLDCWAK